MGPEEDIREMKSMCEGCPVSDKCPLAVGFMSKECKELLEEQGEM